MATRVQHLDLADFLLIAEETLGIEAGYLATLCDLGRADAALNAPAACVAGRPLHPGIAEQGAALVSRLLDRPPVPARAPEVALGCLFEFLDRNKRRWHDRVGDEAALGERIRAVTEHTTADETRLARWIAAHLEP